jgi:CTP:molybdopterin cytidylyltransferase MocA
MSSSSTTAGIVLAAGASSRMGYPKALLPLSNGTPLAMHQMRLLRAAGCARVAVVLGSTAEAIAKKITDGEVIRNPDWERGRLTSIQAGLRGLPGHTGYLILPVDTVGIRPETLARILGSVTPSTSALRPFHLDQPGRVLWVSAATALEILALPNHDTPLDTWLGERATEVSVDDPSVLNNTNTPDDWSALREHLG